MVYGFDYPCEAKTAPFYFCNNFIRTSSTTTIFGTHILQYKFPIIHIFHILYIIKDRKPA